MRITANLSRNNKLVNDVFDLLLCVKSGSPWRATHFRNSLYILKFFLSFVTPDLAIVVEIAHGKCRGNANCLRSLSAKF